MFLILLLTSVVAVLLCFLVLRKKGRDGEFSSDFWESRGIPVATYPKSGLMGTSPSTCDKVVTKTENVITVAIKYV